MCFEIKPENEQDVENMLSAYVKQVIVQSRKKFDKSHRTRLQHEELTSDGEVESFDINDVYGIERSVEMVEQARLHGFPCEQGDITDFEMDRQFDVVISLFHVISYVNTNEALTKVFKNASKHLPPGGLFIFDVWYSPAVYHQKPEPRIKKVENSEISVIRFAEPEIHSGTNVVDLNYTILVKDKHNGQIIEFKEKHPMRHFSVPEIKLIASYTGFEVVKTEEFLTGNVPSEETWGVNFILKKNG